MPANIPNTEAAEPNLDLTLDRVVDVPRDRIWAAWTTPDLLMKWFTPAPWKTIDCEIDLRPGGIFRTVMKSPDGQEFPGEGCYLEVIPNEKLVWTNALGPCFRPSKSSGCSDGEFFMTAMISLQDCPEGTRYKAVVLHGNEESKTKHEAMGFHEGWGKALDQLVAMVKDM